MFVYPKRYDVIVVGAGHAGVEAALVASRAGCQTLLLTLNPDSIGQMSCNPAIGGLAKGQLVREIDALGGEMGKNADMSGLQFRMLNSNKGSAVWAPRAQCDKKAYQFRLKWVCEKQPNLDIKQAEGDSLLLKDGGVLGIETTLKVQYLGATVILTTGTFLKGLMHIGKSQQTGGRAGDRAAFGMSMSLKNLGLELGRLKTGTPPRLSRRSIDFSKTQIQLGDEPVPHFTFWKEDLFHMEQAGGVMGRYPPDSILARINGQLPCYITRTTKRTMELIKENLDKSPMYSGIIEGAGPRYCPSIEDKIVKFEGKDSHQIFLEPEGIATDEIYVNGLSTCLPYDVQVELVKTVIGCENAEIVRPAYAIEYDFAFPTQLLPSLETKICRNLYLAGQINGTSGYEEAAAQGLIAGINAVLRVRDKDPIILRRDEAYIGVLIDDLVTKGTVEPYRMFSSRAEYRLLLRQDNADMRLTPIGHSIGIVSNSNYNTFLIKKAAIEAETARLETTRVNSETLAQLLRRPEIHYYDLPSRNDSLPNEVVQQVEISVKYAGYIERQEMEVAKLKNFEGKKIPELFDYDSVPSLRNEARQKLKQIRPATVGQASRISGVSPADVGILMVWLKRSTLAKGSSPQEECSGEHS